jgi:hypothetical protein
LLFFIYFRINSFLCNKLLLQVLNIDEKVDYKGTVS